MDPKGSILNSYRFNLRFLGFILIFWLLSYFLSNTLGLGLYLIKTHNRQWTKIDLRTAHFTLNIIRYRMRVEFNPQTPLAQKRVNFLLNPWPWVLSWHQDLWFTYTLSFSCSGKTWTTWLEKIWSCVFFRNSNTGTNLRLPNLGRVSLENVSDWLLRALFSIGIP